MKQKKENKKEKIVKRGFAMAESLIAVAVLSIGIVAAVSLVSKGLTESIDSKNQAIAAMLAQEGTELVRNIRDNNWASGARRSFDTGNNSEFPVNQTVALSEGKNCVAFYNLGVLECGDAAENKLKLDSGYYVKDATGGKFQRKITIKYLNASGGTIDNDSADMTEDEAAKAVVTSVVIWGDDFPIDSNGDGFIDVDNSTCNTMTKCAYNQVVLDKWRR